MTKCPQCGYDLNPFSGFENDHMDDAREDYWADQSVHVDSGTYKAAIQFETRNEELYRKNREMMQKLIDEIGKAEIRPDIKSRFLDGLKDASENTLSTGLIVECIKHVFGL